MYVIVIIKCTIFSFRILDTIFLMKTTLFVTLTDEFCAECMTKISEKLIHMNEYRVKKSRETEKQNPAQLRRKNKMPADGKTTGSGFSSESVLFPEGLSG